MNNNEFDGCDIVKLANRKIWDFVHEASNCRLKPGTGYYSTPFRGSLFGEEGAASVTRQLSQKNAEILWLGANPGVPQSLANILASPNSDGDFPGFEMQMKSGFFSSRCWLSDGTPKPDWNPIERPQGAWRVYHEVFRQTADLECVAMANFLPWGSKNAEEFVRKLGAAEPQLLQRVLDFSDQLNIDIVHALRPKLIVVPFSAERMLLAAGSSRGLSVKQASSVKSYSISLPSRAFNFTTAYCWRGTMMVRTLYVPHPASLRLSKSDIDYVINEIISAIKEK